MSLVVVNLGQYVGFQSIGGSLIEEGARSVSDHLNIQSFDASYHGYFEAVVAFERPLVSAWLDDDFPRYWVIVPPLPWCNVHYAPFFFLP